MSVPTTEKRSKRELAKAFNAGVFELINMAMKKTRDEMTSANLDRAKKRINLLISNMSIEAPLDEAYVFWIDYSDNILEPDATKRDNFFLTINIRAEYAKYNKQVKPEDEFLFTLADAIREMYKQSSAELKTNVYKVVKSLLDCSLEYADLVVDSVV